MLARAQSLTKERKLCCGLFSRNLLRPTLHCPMGHCRSSRLRENSVYTQKSDGNFHIALISK
jgi:hypothetical protein